MLDLRSRGLLLALCSKNNAKDVWEVLSQQPEMLLRREHVSAALINWNAKSSNLRLLADQLPLGLDSFIFLDDSRLECAEVQANPPQVLSLPLPSPDELTDFLDHVWALDQPRVTREDQQRAELYEHEWSRQVDRQTASSLRAFLQSLNLEVTFLTVTQDLRARLAQLSQRTNQFNCTLKRYTEAELSEYLKLSHHRAFVVDVCDKFGRYGVCAPALIRFW